MRSEILNIFKEKFIIKISIILISLFPIILLLGSSILNVSIVLMNVLFLIHIFNQKQFRIFNNDIFFLLFFLWIFLIINTLLNDNFKLNYSRAFGFIRFILLIILLSYFLSYKNFQFKKTIFNIWSIIFIIVSLDLVFEFIYGFNILGNKSPYDGRLVGFMGDQLKIGHWYLCFSLIALGNFFHTNKFYFFLFLSVIISFLIGERANFIRLFLAILFLIFITRQLSFKNLSFLIVVFGVIFLIANYAGYMGKHADFKKRYVDQVVNILKLKSSKKINNNNSYTPMYINAYYVFKENKLLGVGLGSYAKKSNEKYRKIWHPLFLPTHKINGYEILGNTHPHQHHLEILATLGLPGYIFISLLLLYFFYKNFYFFKISRKPINLASFLFILVFFVPLLPTGSFFTTYGAAMFWLNFSLMNLGNFKNINY